MRHVTFPSVEGRVRGEEGAVLVIVSVCLVVLVGFSALLVDGAMLIREHAIAKGAASSSALAAAVACSQGTSPTAVADTYARDNVTPDLEAAVSTASCSADHTVTVDVAVVGTSFLANVWGVTQLHASASATATWKTTPGETVVTAYGRCTAHPIVRQSLSTDLLVGLPCTSNGIGPSVTLTSALSITCRGADAYVAAGGSAATVGATSCGKPAKVPMDINAPKLCSNTFCVYPTEFDLDKLDGARWLNWKRLTGTANVILWWAKFTTTAGTSSVRLTA